MSESKYQIADRDELEALGNGGDPPQDTSAALQPDDDVPLAEAASSSSRRRKCVIMVVVMFTVIGIGVFLGVFLTQQSGGGGNGTDENPPATTPSPVSAPPANTQAPTSNPDNVPTYKVSVVSKLPHDQEAFLQGFEYSNGQFYEGTGLNGRSSLRRVEMDTGKVLDRYDYTDPQLFGEGITLHEDAHIFMITWQHGRGFIFNQSTLELLDEWKYDGEGWGLTMDRKNNEVIMSDGTDEIRVLDPEGMAEKRRIKVTYRGERVTEINELEWVCGEIWANIWQTSDVYRIDPVSGVVKSVINAGNLPEKEDVTPGMNVMNGIAFDPDTGRLWFTGKLWKTIYQVTVSDSSLDLTSCK